MQIRYRLSVYLVILLSSTLPACSGPPPEQPGNGAYQQLDPPAAGDVNQNRVLNAHSEPGQWLLNNRTFRQQRYSPLSRIGPENLDQLGLAWEFRDFVMRGRTHHGVEANPIHVDGVLYFSGPWGVAYAVDAKTGEHLWTYKPGSDGAYARKACCDVVNRGVAVWKGRVYTASLDGWLAALDAATGEEEWRVNTFADRSGSYTITGAPHIAGDNILIGNSGADMGGVRGYVSAYNYRTGELAWRFWTVPGDPAAGPDETAAVSLARETWSEDTRWELGGGGTVWDSMAYDPELGLVYLGVGNGGPHPIWLRSPGGGDNLFLSSIVAVDADTGELEWYYQTTPGDSWDFAACSHLMLAGLNWNGRKRKVIMQAPKNGLFYVLDRKTGELLAADPYTTVNWTDGVDMDTGRPTTNPEVNYSESPKIVWPGAPGGHAWQPMAMSRNTGLVYLPVYDAPMKTSMEPVKEIEQGRTFEGMHGEFPPFTTEHAKQLLEGQPEPKMETRLKAWDPKTGKAVWQSDPLPFVSGGVLTTASGLVIQGSTDGVLSFYDANTGEVLHRIETGTAIMPAPITYMLDGVQYLAVLAGAGGPQAPRWGPGVAARRYENFERLMVFRLDGDPVPLPPSVQEPEQQPLPEPIPADKETIAHGKELFQTFCRRCHAPGGGRGAYPDLWNMPLEVLNSFEAIVYDGIYSYAGMASFADVLSKQDIHAVKAFIVNDRIERETGDHDGGRQPRPARR